RLHRPADQARLLTQDQDTVEITHEALLRAWPRLRQWIDSDRDGNLIRQQLEPAQTWLWETDPKRAATSICDAISANLVITRSQWQQYFPGQPYDPPCPGRR
ncbi:MAG TPA: hypothetical protein VHS30_07815, partial [Streptosporangiaceae bacterium]|nr:hypothetical protein [Streptosporangiaceae bacterium]